MDQAPDELTCNCFKINSVLKNYFAELNGLLKLLMLKKSITVLVNGNNTTTATLNNCGN
jgi:hypothetical protein